MKIERLTKEQIKLLEVVKNEWINYFDSCPKSNKENITQGVKWLYKTSKLKEPLIIIVQSPVGAQIAANILSKTHGQVREQVEQEVGQQVGQQVSLQVREQVGQRVREQVGLQVGQQVWQQVGERVREQVRQQVREQVKQQVREQVWQQVGEQVGQRVREQVRQRVREQVKQQVREQVEQEVGQQVRQQVWQQVGQEVSLQVGQQKMKLFQFSLYGNIWDFSWLSFYDAFERIGVKNNTEDFISFRTLMQSGVYDMIQLDGVCIVSEMPTELYRAKSERRPLHKEGGAAIVFGDGYKLWFLNGINVDQWMAETPRDELDAKEILKIENVDQRREVLRRLGVVNLVKQLGGKIIDTDYKSKWGLVSKYELLELDIGLDEPCKYLKMNNPSIDAIHVEGVGNECKTVQEALNWRRHSNTKIEWNPSQLT